MTEMEILDYMVNFGKKHNLERSIDSEVVDEIKQKYTMTTFKLIGTLLNECVAYSSELSNMKDLNCQLQNKIAVQKKMIETIEHNQNVRMHDLKRQMQKSGLKTAKKYNKNKFKQLIEMGFKQKEIMEQLNISQATYYRYLSAYKDESNSQ